ncbi:hypothetical protein F2P56_027514 [Juglans regia]|uniref:Uncharacterized protein LOC109005839 isoform X2 n=2 Tax=Juglans regia TaxID=51240 RepID=A0A2I4G973_JUGRE|nr:uncharacterized protein LOC109005839 isoform X2 [Juglans regia]KAF5452530.1 hypothetical protein F2P56_027514 [Juglans regia]
MILPLQPHNLIFSLIPIQNRVPFLTRASFFLLVVVLLLISSALSPTATNAKPLKKQHPRINMKVHPIPRKRNITVQYDMNARDPLSEAQALLGLSSKKLRRLPHVFSRVLELPFRSDADVSVEEKPDCFRFIAETDNDIRNVRAHTVEIHPGVTKIVVRESGSLELSLDELELDMWRFRLPESTRPELASAAFVDGELIVTVPKGEEGVENAEENGVGGGGDEDVWRDENGEGFRGGIGVLPDALAEIIV